MNKKLIRELVKMIGVFLLFGMFLTLYIVFLGAYQNPEKAAIVYINRFNEAGIEFYLLFPVVFILGLFSVYLCFRDYLKQGLKR